MNHGYHSIKEMTRTTISGVVPTEALDRSYIIPPKYIKDNCVGCGRCYLSCRDGGHQAIQMVDGKPKFDGRRCVGCHLCVLVCSNGAIVSSNVKVSKKAHSS